MTRVKLSWRLNSHRTGEELLERARSLADLIEDGDMVLDENDCLQVTIQGRAFLPPVLPPTQT